MRLGDCGDDVGRAATGRNQTYPRFFRHARIAERHVAGAAFMLRVDEFHMRPFGDGVADRKRSVRQDAKDVLHAS